MTTTVVELEQRRLGGGLLGEHVERGAGDRDPSRMRVGQRRLVDDAATRHVDDPQAGLRLGQQLGADQPQRLGRLGDVERDEVGLRRPARRGRRARRRAGGPGPVATNGSYATSCIPKASARWATSLPMRPRPMMPSVLSASSTPSHLERSHRPAMSAAWAWGMLRAWASSSAMVCSAAERMLDCGALTTITPAGWRPRRRRCRARSRRDPRPRGRCPPSSTSAVTVVAERMISACGALDRSSSSSGDEVELDVDLVAAATQAVEPASGERLQRRAHEVMRSRILSGAGLVTAPVTAEPVTAGRRLVASCIGLSSSLGDPGLAPVEVLHVDERGVASRYDAADRIAPAFGPSPAWRLASGHGRRSRDRLRHGS